MTTIREVAKRAGVSYATVSHVINDTRFVSQNTRDRVLAAMSELKYRPNALARSLRRGETNTIGLILPDSSNPFFAEIGRSIEDAAFKLSYKVILCNTERDTHREQLYVDVLSKHQVDGIIFVATGDQVDSLDFLLSQEMPVVLVDRDLPKSGVDAVLTDNQQGGYLATRHLIELGHRRIACIMGPSNINTSAERVNGYRRALEEEDMLYDESLLFLGDYHPDSGLVATCTLLNLDSPPTAIFALNDLMAVGALRAAAKSGHRVPEDLAIIGYDDIELARFMNPPLTTIAQPKTEIGFQAVNLLANRIADKNCPARRLTLSPELIVRGSTTHNPVD
ncbi:MAG TPA: LacI family DNA-binding transcriptional regulator [Anaerolineales bacterium]|nr:LacI family DNA-binding transcriptional regulator [Anaerolineales bacterium]